MARDPDHGGERLVLVVQPQARLGHGHDLGQPVPPSPAQRLQADGAASAGAPLPADHPACAYARAQGAGREHQPQVAERLAWGKAGYFLVGSGFGALHRPAGIVERVLYGGDAERVYIRIDSPRSPSELELQKIQFWLYCSGVPADEPGGKLELPLQVTAAADFGFDAAYVVRIVPHARGASLTIARVDQEQARAETLAELDEPDALFVSIP